jgi:hypothetical protein
MDVLVLVEESLTVGDALLPGAAGSPAPVAHVNSVPATPTFDGRGRDVVTLYGAADARTLALALAAVMEGRDALHGHGARRDVVRHLGVWPEGGAHGDAAWRDRTTGQLRSQDLDISAATLAATAERLLGTHGAAIRRMVAGLAMPDWPEGTRRALHAHLDAEEPAYARGDAELLDVLREADGYDEGD